MYHVYIFLFYVALMLLMEIDHSFTLFLFHYAYIGKADPAIYICLHEALKKISFVPADLAFLFALLVSLVSVLKVHSSN